MVGRIHNCSSVRRFRRVAIRRWETGSRFQVPVHFLSPGIELVPSLEGLGPPDLREPSLGIHDMVGMPDWSGLD
jgi:hypothetical protein